MKTEYNIRIEDLELRSAKNTAEIVRWAIDPKDNEYCYSIAYWTRDKEIYNLHLSGDRFPDANEEHLITLAIIGQRILTLKARVEEETKYTRNEQ